MNKIIPIFLLVLAPLFSKSQVYTPLNLDTSCYWIQSYNDYQAGPKAWGEVLQYVEKDTLIGPYNYHIIKGYCTDPSLPITSYAWYFYNCYNPKIIIREDSVSRKIYRFDLNQGLEIIWLDFDFSLQDTVLCLDTTYSNPPPCLIVDSVKITNHYGLSSNTVYSNWYTTILPPFVPLTGITIFMEGIGINYNFPDAASGEWGIPRFRLEAFVKNDSILYKSDFYPIDSCYRKPQTFRCWPSSVKDTEENNSNIVYSANRLIIKDCQEGVKLRLIDMSGKIYYEKYFQYPEIVDFSNYSTGIYILSIQSSKGIENRKILIR